MIIYVIYAVYYMSCLRNSNLIINLMLLSVSRYRGVWSETHRFALLDTYYIRCTKYVEFECRSNNKNHRCRATIACSSKKKSRRELLSGYYPPNFWMRIGFIISSLWYCKNVKLNFDSALLLQ